MAGAERGSLEIEIFVVDVSIVAETFLPAEALTFAGVFVFFLSFTGTVTAVTPILLPRTASRLGWLESANERTREDSTGCTMIQETLIHIIQSCRGHDALGFSISAELAGLVTFDGWKVFTSMPISEFSRKKAEAGTGTRPGHFCRTCPRSFVNLPTRQILTMAFPYPTAMDPSKVMEFLGSLPEAQQEDLLNQAMHEFDEQAEQMSNPQEELIQRFKKSRATYVRPGGIFAEHFQAGRIHAGSVCTKFTTGDAKPASESRSLRALSPMIAKELDLGTTHRGRYLCGWVAVDDAFFGISATSLLLEDVTGYLVEIAVYGLVDDSLSLHQRQAYLASQFPKGKSIVVVEPYYKIRLDGSLGIRVEDPAEIVRGKPCRRT